MQRSDFDQDYGQQPGKRRGLAAQPILLGLLAIALFALGFLAFVFSADRLENRETATDDTTSEETADTTSSTEDDTDAAGGDTESSSAEGVATSDEESTDDEAAAAESDSDDNGALPAPADTPDGAFVEATLNLDAGPGPGLFQLSGRVPDAETAEALMTAAELSYAPFVESDLEVDESLEPAPWLAATPQLIGLLPSVTDGTIRIVDGEVELLARSPNPEYLAQLQGALELLSGGMPIQTIDQNITDLVPPEFYVAVDDGAMTLSGTVPSDSIKQILESGAVLAYGEDSVSSELTVDESTYTSFWMYTMPGIFQLFGSFPKYQLQVVDGVSSGTLHCGVNFELDSTEISDEAAQVLNIGVSILARDLSIFMTVEGHTDSSGPDDYNQALSEARAQSVVAYFAAAGIENARLVAAGAGESEPIASNDSDEGMALNRRVEFVFGPPPDG